MRGQAKMTWVKIYISGWLHGSIRWQLEPAERGVWADLIVMAGQCLLGGQICDNDGLAFPLDFIANQLNISRELLDTTLDKCVKEGRVIVKDGVISIVNWTAYQSEYERQKKYRTDPKEPEQPKDYQGGKFGHMVIHSKDDLKRIKQRKKEVNSESPGLDKG